MNAELVDKIAHAVLYEGYILYPYRPSAIKNRQRWNFGVLYPEAWAASQTGSDRAYFQSECLAVGGGATKLDVSVRFLHVMARGSHEERWEEAVERSVSIRELNLDAIVFNPHCERFVFTPDARVERDSAYRRQPIEAEVEIRAVPVTAEAFRISVRVRNTTELAEISRAEALLRSLVSAHAVLTIRDGQFVSLTDPPDALREAAAQCENVGVWPVLAGAEGSGDTILASPIILPDYPQIAAESSGDLFDGTEIDEILTLRILTMTDSEKEEMRQSDERARRILERLETAPAEHLMQLHGEIRALRPEGRHGVNPAMNMDPWTAASWETTPQLTRARISGVDVRKGDRVRLKPGPRADIFDMFLADKVAVVEAIEQDYENRVHLAVVLEDDPGRDLGEMRQAGHRFFFSDSEVEPIAPVPSESERGR